MAPTLARTLAVSRSQLGTAEPGSSGDSPGQRTKYGDWFAAWAHNPGFADTYWCAIYQSWVLAAAGFSLAEAGRYASCNAWIRWLKNQGLWSLRAQPGALVFYDWDNDGLADHIGMVESVRPNGQLVTLEGNASLPHMHDGVRRMVRGRGAVMGFGALRYAAEPPPPGPPLVPPASGSLSAHMPGPVSVPAGFKAPRTGDARYLGWRECPAMSVGFGGPEDPAQRIWAAYWFALMARWSPGYFRAVYADPAGRAEVERHEIGPVTIHAADAMVHQVLKTAPAWRGIMPSQAWALYQPSR